MGRHRQGEPGVALMIVIAVVAILSVIVLEFSQTVWVNMTIAGNFEDRVKARAAARGGVAYAIAILRRDQDPADYYDEEWAQPHDIVLGTLAEGFAETEPEEEEAAGSGAAGEEPAVAPVAEAEPLSWQARAHVTITDEDSKINVNNLVTLARVGDPRMKRIVTNLIDELGVVSVSGDEIASAIMDWLDADNAGGSETEYYEGLEPPYPCRDAPMMSIEELRLVRGVTDELLYGTKPYPKPWEEETAWETETTEGTYGLVNFLAARSLATPNINTVSREVLTAIVDRDLFLTENLLLKRDQQPFLTPRDLMEYLRGIDPQNRAGLQRAFSVRSRFFLIESVGMMGRAKVAATALVSRSIQRNVQVVWYRLQETE